MDATQGVGARILIVDDQPDQVEMYRIGLEYAGFTVDEAINGAAAVERAVNNPPDVIVLDIRLPDISGWDVCRILKTDPRTAAIPIIILTAAATATLAEQSAESGCAAYLLKPCLPDDLTNTVRQVLRSNAIPNP
jgi:CheY-like chemotaxis protein